MAPLKTWPEISSFEIVWKPEPVLCVFFFLQLRLEVNQLVTVTNLMKKLHNSRNYALASFLLGSLQYNPSKFIDTNSTVLC